MTYPEQQDDYEDDIDGNLDTDTDSDEDIEIEEEDDTPEHDRGRKPLDFDPTDDEHSAEDNELPDKFKRRASVLTKAVHDERRAREAAERQANEAINYAKGVQAQLQQQRQNNSLTQKAYATSALDNAENSVASSRRAVTTAYEAGDAEALVKAQEELANNIYHRNQIRDSKQVIESMPDEVEDDYTPANPHAPAKPAVHPATEDWVSRNSTWFQKDKEMTNYAMAVHMQAINDGIAPNSKAYFREIDTAMRNQYPQYSWDGKPRQRPGTRVASGRNTAPSTGGKKVVRLTSSQLQIAKRLGITPQQYAAELAKLER